MAELVTAFRRVVGGLPLIAFIAARAFGAPGHIQGRCIGPSSGSSFVVTLPGPVTAGNTLIVGIDLSNSMGIVSISDDAGATFVLALAPDAGGAADAEQVWFASSVAGGSNQVRVTLPASNQVAIFVNEYAGLASTPAGGTSAFANSGPYTSASLALDAGQFVVYGFAVSGPSVNFTGVQAPFVDHSTDCWGDVAADELVQGPVSASATFVPSTGSSSWSYGVLAFAVAVDAGVDAGSGPGTDAGPNTPRYQVGCDCSTATGWFCVAVGLWLSLPRRRSRPQGSA